MVCARARGYEMDANDWNDHKNALSTRLIAQGYTRDSHPDNVHWTSFMEFEYTEEYRRTLTFKLPCGLLTRYGGINGAVHSGSMSYMGIDWTIENDCAAASCPYRKGCLTCDARPVLLRNLTVPTCTARITDEPYDYEHSAEKASENEDERICALQKVMLTALAKEVHARGEKFCPHHAKWIDCEERYTYNYDPWFCKDSFCRNERCLISGVNDGFKNGYVLYDVYETIVRRDGSLLDGDVTTIAHKGMKLWDKPVRMAVCEQVARLCYDDILRTVQGKRIFHSNLFFEEYHWKDKRYTLRVENIHATQKIGRDLEQDLKDLQDGVRVVHESDLQKEKAAQKKQNKEKRRESKLRSIEKEVAQGFSDLPEHRKQKALKLLGETRIEELIKQRPEKKPEQLSFFP